MSLNLLKSPALPTVEELNETQRQWMALQHDAPEKVKQAVFKRMERYPCCYVSGHDGFGICIVDGQPFSASSIPFAQALSICHELNGRTDVAWNGMKGEWYAI